MESDFSGRVFKRAWADWWEFFGAHLIRSGFFVLASLAIGFLIFWRVRGLEHAMEEIYVNAAFLLAPAGLLAVAVYFWNLWLAPMRLVLDELRTPRGEEYSVLSEVRQNLSPPDFEVWKNLQTMTVTEIACLCAGEDPYVGGKTGRHVPYQGLIFQGIREDEIKCESPATGGPLTGSPSTHPKVYVDDVCRYLRKKRVETKYCQTRDPF